MVDETLLRPKLGAWDHVLIFVGLKETPGFKFGKGKGARFILALDDTSKRHAYLVQCLNEGGHPVDSPHPIPTHTHALNMKPL
jgi:hypothetical protein